MNNILNNIYSQKIDLLCNTLNAQSGAAIREYMCNQNERDRDISIIMEQATVMIRTLQNELESNRTCTQKVVRTRPTGKGYNYEADAYLHLDNALNEGYKVMFCNSIGTDLEYVLEKEHN